MFALFWGTHNTQGFRKLGEQNREYETLPIYVLLGLTYNHCLIMSVAILGQNNVKLNFCDDS